MHRFLLHNDEVRDSSDLIVSPGQIGFANGWGVFSTLRVYDGVLFAFERHWERMSRDAARMSVPFPESPGWLEDRLHRLVEANQAWNSTLRVMVVRNRGGKWLRLWEGPAASAREFELIALTAPVNEWGRGVRLGLVPQARHAASELTGTKILSWSQNLYWYERAHQQGFDETVLLNERGEVAECTSANIFAVEGDRVWTPPLTAGCLPGVTRAILLEEVGAPGLTIGEKTLMPADLEAANEVFITSTTRELLPVVSVAGLKIRDASATRDRLQAAFSGYTQKYAAPRRRPVAAL